MDDVKELLESLIKFEQGEEYIPTRTQDPVLDISGLVGDAQSGRAVAKGMLHWCAAGDMGKIDEEINLKGLQYSIYGTPYQTVPGVLVPLITRYTELPVGIFAVARTADSGHGECWASMVQECKECSKFFLAKTKRRSRFCEPSCRTAYVNRERRKSGYFRDYYKRNKIT